MPDPAPFDPSPDDDALMRALSGPDGGEALTELIARHREKLANYLRRSGVQGDVEDLVQEVFLRVWNARHRWRPTARVTTWLHTLARNVFIDRVRREARFLRWRREALAVAEPAGPPSVGAHPDVDAALATLSEDFRAAVVLVVCQGLTYPEAAQVLDVPEGTVKSRVHEALRRLRHWFQTP
jgi:RNA polymerase sigma-70 factor (ECF subfamily)